MPTTGVDLLLAAFHALSTNERTEALERIQMHVNRELADDDTEAVRFLRSLLRVRDELGHAPTVDEYKETALQLAAGGVQVEPFSRVYRRYGSWARAREAIDLAETTTARRIEARFASRHVGKVWRYTDETLRTTLLEATEAIGHPPTVAEFDWWRERELEKARSEGNDGLHLPSAGPYRKRWGSWAGALRGHGFDEQQLQERLEDSRKGRQLRDPDSALPADLPVATFRHTTPAGLLLDDAQTHALRQGWDAMSKRSRFILTARLGLLHDGETWKLREAGDRVGVHLSRAHQLHQAAVEELRVAVYGEGSPRDAEARIIHALRELTRPA